LRKILISLKIVYGYIIIISILSISTIPINVLGLYPDIATDPETLENAFYGKVVCDDGLQLRTGPGNYFPEITRVPKGAKVPVIFWLNPPIPYGEGTQMWIRTEYKGKYGWLCAFEGDKRVRYKGGRYIEYEGGPLFPLKVIVDNLKFNHFYSFDWIKDKIPKGEDLEFISLCNGWKVGSGNYMVFVVKYKDTEGHITAYENNKWYVDYPQRLLDLKLSYNYPSFDFVWEFESLPLRMGPDEKYKSMSDLHFTYFGPIIFRTGRWALIPMAYNCAWIDMGTEEKPEVKIYKTLSYHYMDDNFNEIIGDKDKADEIWGDKGIEVFKDCWPVSNLLHVGVADYFMSKNIDDVKINSVEIYQPPDAEKPLYSIPAAKEDIDRVGWYETIWVYYSVHLPEDFKSEELNKLVINFEIGDVKDLRLDFVHNPDE